MGGGARAAYFDVPGAEQHAFALYSLADATRLRNHILRCVELADAHPELIDRGLLTFVIVGGGPTGVEMAGGLFEVCVGVLRKDFPALHAHTARVILIERLDVVLSAFHPRSQHYALKALRQRGVDVRFGETVTAVEPDSLVLVNGERIETSTVIWAAGVQTETLADALGAERSRGGRVVVMPNLSVAGHPEVFVTGDMANASASDGRSHPQVAQVAIQSGRHAADEVVRRILGHSTEPFVYKNKGIMATIGRRSAVAELPSGLAITGTLGWLVMAVLAPAVPRRVPQPSVRAPQLGLELRDQGTGATVDLRLGRVPRNRHHRWARASERPTIRMRRRSQMSRSVRRAGPPAR